MTQCDLNDLKRKWGNRGDTDETESFAPEMDMQSYNQHLQFCWNSCRKTQILTMPWDARLKMPHEIMSDAFKVMPMSGQMPPVPIAQQSTQPSGGTVEHSVFHKAGLRFAKATDERLWKEKLSWERKCAYKKWSSLILEQISAWEIGRQVASSGQMSFAQGGLMESLHDALGTKATSTLHARAGPLLRYVGFWKDVGCKCFPITEPMLYDYLKAWDGAAPSAYRSLLLSLSFSSHVLGLQGGDIGYKSGRIKGLSDAHFCKRKKLVQRPPLTVEQVAWLENIVKDGNKFEPDRIAAGYFLLLVFGRLRYSDAMNISDMRIDAIMVDGTQSGYLECKAERTKTSLTLERKIRFLPVAVPLVGFTDPCWVMKWLELREKHGLVCGPGRPLITSPVQGGGWSKVPLPVGMAAEWLRGLLKCDEETAGRIATHSCKSTLLSMCAKFGVEGTMRRFLGYHSHSKDQSLLTYSRDAMALPLRRLGTVIEAIRNKQFFPDHTRSGYFAEDFQHQRHEGSSDDDGSDDTGSRDSESEEDVDAEGEEIAVNKVVGTWAPPPEPHDSQYARHVTSRCIHLLSDEGGNHFKCGRSVSNRYKRLDAKPDFMHPVCQGCFRV